jgi:hypothetical protein
MKLFAKSGAVVLGLLAAAVLLVPTAGTVEARPQYKKVFEKKYDKVKPVNCKICHPSDDDKKERNEYGQAVAKALGAKKVTDTKKIEKALDTVAKEKDKDGKPYGDKLKKGERPVGE